MDKAITFINKLRTYDDTVSLRGEVLERPSLPPCRDHFRTMWGLPCSHDIVQAHQDSLPMSSLNIVPHWRLWKPLEMETMVREGANAFQEGVWVPEDAPEVPAAVLNPWMRFQRVEYRNVQVVSQMLAARTSQRLPSSGEVADAIANGVPRRVTRCSGCGNTGHDVRRCRREEAMARRAATRAETRSVRGMGASHPTQTSTQFSTF